MGWTKKPLPAFIPVPPQSVQEFKTPSVFTCSGGVNLCLLIVTLRLGESHLHLLPPSTMLPLPLPQSAPNGLLVTEFTLHSVPHFFWGGSGTTCAILTSFLERKMRFTRVCPWGSLAGIQSALTSAPARGPMLLYSEPLQASPPVHLGRQQAWRAQGGGQSFSHGLPSNMALPSRWRVI